MAAVAGQAVICEPVRTPIGRYGGMFSSLTAVDLGVAALRGLLERTGVTPDAVEDVILGHCYPSMEAPAIGRVVALDAAAATDHLLVASDFDGTLAPIVNNPADARALPRAAEAIVALAELPGTSVVLVSGRALATLRELSAMPSTA